MKKIILMIIVLVGISGFPAFAVNFCNAMISGGGGSGSGGSVSAFPTFPMSFYGVAKLDGNNLPNGTKILVYSGATLVGETLVEDGGIYGYDSLVKKRLVVTEYSGELIFKYQLAGNNSEVGGVTVVKYSQNFIAGNSILFNMNFVSSSSTGSGSNGGGGTSSSGGGSNVSVPAIIIPKATTTPSIASATNDVIVLGVEYDASKDLNLIIKNTIEAEKKALGKIDEKLAKRLSGRILLQIESHGEAWYVNPRDVKKYYLANGNEAYRIMRYLSVGITNKNLDKIKTDKTFAKKFSGKIFLQVEAHGEAYYIDINGNVNYLKNGTAAYTMMRNLGMGISNFDLRKIGVGEI